MRVLVVGAGAVGGYFGARMALGGEDVTFLVRPARAQALAKTGLVIKSPKGDATLANVQTVRADTIGAPYDLVLLSCKAYDLESAMDSFAPAVGPGTVILPMLNGMRHLDLLAERFGRDRVLGGVCLIAATLDAQGAIMHLNDSAAIAFGELDGADSERMAAIARTLRAGGFHVDATTSIVQQMWEKWVFLATLAGSTCLFRASVGDILATPDGRAVLEALLGECHAIAEAHGHPMRAPFAERTQAMLFAPGSTLTASMLRDIENGLRTEGQHVLGDLLARGAAVGRAGEASGHWSILRLAYTHVLAYEARRAR